jgi:hypothetical protein
VWRPARQFATEITHSKPANARECRFHAELTCVPASTSCKKVKV